MGGNITIFESKKKEKTEFARGDGCTSLHTSDRVSMAKSAILFSSLASGILVFQPVEKAECN
jgi:hypothetical protein